MNDPLVWLRRTALVEALSYLALLGAMPLKYACDMPMPVRVIGMLHGVLWLLLVWQIAKAHYVRGWPRSRAVLIFVASLVPLWPFFLDRRMRAWIAATPPPA